LLNIDQKMILLDHLNNFIVILKIMSNAAKNFDILATSLSVLHLEMLPLHVNKARSYERN